MNISFSFSFLLLEPRNVGGLELLGVLFWRLPSSEETGHCNSSRCREKPLSAQYPKTDCTWFILRINPDGTKCLNHKIKITDQPAIWKKGAEKNCQPESSCDIFHQRACWIRLAKYWKKTRLKHVFTVWFVLLFRMFFRNF